MKPNCLKIIVAGFNLAQPTFDRYYEQLVSQLGQNLAGSETMMKLVSQEAFGEEVLSDKASKQKVDSFRRGDLFFYHRYGGVLLAEQDEGHKGGSGAQPIHR